MARASGTSVDVSLPGSTTRLPGLYTDITLSQIPGHRWTVVGYVTHPGIVLRLLTDNRCPHGLGSFAETDAGGVWAKVGDGDAAGAAGANAWTWTRGYLGGGGDIFVGHMKSIDEAFAYCDMRAAECAGFTFKAPNQRPVRSTQYNFKGISEVTPSPGSTWNTYTRGPAKKPSGVNCSATFPGSAGGPGDPFTILGVPLQSGAAAVKQAYRAQNKLFHPDKQLGKTAAQKGAAKLRLRAVQDAYETLTDKRLRAGYERAAAAKERDWNFRMVRALRMVTCACLILCCAATGMPIGNTPTSPHARHRRLTTHTHARCRSASEASICTRRAARSCR